MRPTFPPSTSIADWIKDIRDAVSLDQTEFGKKFGVSQSSVARWETGEAVPEYPRLLALQRIDEALQKQETREAKDRAAVDSLRISELRDEINTAYDLMTALDKAGDGIGGDVEYGVSAVALAARAALDNAPSMLRAIDTSRASRACACAREGA